MITVARPAKTPDIFDFGFLGRKTQRSHCNHTITFGYSQNFSGFYSVKGTDNHRSQSQRMGCQHQVLCCQCRIEHVPVATLIGSGGAVNKAPRPVQFSTDDDYHRRFGNR